MLSYDDGKPSLDLRLSVKGNVPMSIKGVGVMMMLSYDDGKPSLDLRLSVKGMYRHQ